MESIDSPLVCIIETEAYSMGAMIASYCPTLYIHKFAMVMFHEASYTAQGSTSRINIRVSATNKFLSEVFGDTAKQLGLSPAEFAAKIHDEWWLTARETVASGIADGIINELKYTYEEPKKPIFPGLFFGDGNGDLPNLPNIESGFLAGDQVVVKTGFYKGCTGTVVQFIPTKKPPNQYRIENPTCERENTQTTFRGFLTRDETDLELAK